MEFRRPLKSSTIIEKYLSGYRRQVAFIQDDVVMYKQINKTVDYLKATELNF